MTTPNDLANQAKQQQTVVPAQVDRVALSLAPRVVAGDSRVAQLQRCIAKAERVMAEANAVPAYLGDNPSKRAVVRDANWRAHNAWLRREAALATIERLAKGA
jgi:hypothetical protein